MELLKVAVGDGKYTVIQDSAGGLHALRHGKPWRDLTGDGLVLALAQETQRLRTALDNIVFLDGVHTPILETCSVGRDMGQIARTARESSS